MYKIHYWKADCYILCGNVDTYIKENENKLEHYKSAYQPVAFNTSHLCSIFSYNNLMFTSEYIKINSMEK